MNSIGCPTRGCRYSPVAVRDSGVPCPREKLIFEFKWLPELETKNRMKGDYLWLKMVYTF
jgi:hypothetical protein